MLLLLLSIPRLVHLFTGATPPPPVFLVHSNTGMRKNTVEPELLLRDPATQPYERPHDGEDDADGDGDAEDVGGDEGALLRGVEERVRVEALGGVRQVGERQIQREQEDEERQVRPRRGPRAREGDLEEGKDAVQSVLRDVAPRRVLCRERRGRGEQGPEDDDDEEGERRDAAVEQTVQVLERPGPGVERGCAAACVDEGVGGCDEEVEGEAPVREDGEVGEVGARGFTPA